MRRLVAGAALLAGLATGCGGADKTTGPSGATPGVLEVRLATTNTDDGAVMFTIAGGPVEQVEAASADYQVFSAQPDSITTRVLLTGNLVAGAIVRLHVADTRRLSAYRGSITQVASRSTFALQAVTGYSLAISE